MKNKTIIALITLITLSVEAAQDFPKLLLNLDINKTLIAEDLATNKTVEYILSDAIAEKCVYQWDTKTEPMTYRKYVDTVLVPGQRAPANKKKRRTLIKEFLSFLATTDHPEKENYIVRYEKSIKKMEDKYLIPSFIKLIQKLQEQQIDFTLILRTFGSDIRIGKITQKIDSLLEGKKFTSWGNFKKGTLTIKQGPTINKVDTIYNLFLNSEGHIVIQDDWYQWSKDNEKGRSGKPFIFDPADRKILSIFVDDKVNSDPCSPYNIVLPMNSEGQSLPVIDHFNRHIFIADTIESILDVDDQYFIDIVNQSLASQGYTGRIH